MKQGLILNAQELSEFEKEIANLGIFGEQQNSAKSELDQPADQGKVSAAEERAWMLHQQDPLSAAGPFTAAFKLSGKINVEQLTAALKALYQGDSNLNQIYKQDEEGELIKQHLQDTNVDIATISDQSDEEIIAFLLKQQGNPIDLASQPAIQFWLFVQSENELVLGILGHHILIDDSAWKPIFAAISSYYNGHALPAASAANEHSPSVSSEQLTKNKQYWIEKYPQGLNKTPFPALFSSASQTNALISDINSRRIAPLTTEANRFHTRISGSNIEQLAAQAQASPFQTLLTLFGLFINQLFNRTSVDILIPIIEHQEISHLDQIRSSSNVIPVSIHTDDTSVNASIVGLRNDLLNGLSRNLPIEQIFSVTKTQRNTHPNILVTQVDDASHYLSLEGIKAENLAVPPLSSDYDLTLAIQLESDGQIRFELTTGHTLSTTIGAFLLEKFVEFTALTTVDRSPNPPSLFTQEYAEIETSSVPAAANLDRDAVQLDPSKQPIVDRILQEFKASLELQNITATDDFFELGGHSLLATRVIGKLKSQHNIEVKIADFFNAPTAVSLAEFAHYTEKALSTVAAVAEDEEIIAPHSYVQLTYMPLIELGRSPIFNIPFTLKFSQPVDETAFQHAFYDALTRHHTLRTLLLVEEGKDPQQRIIAASTLKDYNWFFASTEQGDLTAEQVLTNEANYSWDLTKQLPVRVRFVYNAQGEHFLSLLIYHTAFDEWSTGVLIRDVFYAYREYAGGREPQWQSTPAQFHQHVVEQRKTLDLDAKLAYWKDYLGEVEPIKPLFYSASEPAKEPSAEGAWLEFSFDRAIADKLNRLAQQNKSSMFHVVYAAFSLAMYYLGAGKKVLVATSAYGRDDPKYQDTVGLFTNVVLNHVHFDEALQLNQLVTQIRDNIIASLPHSDAPFVMVEQAVAASPLASPIDNLCEVYIQYHQKNELNSQLELDDGKAIEFELLEPERDIAKFGLHFEAYEDPKSEDAAFRVVLAYRTSHYDNEQITLIKNATEAVVLALAETAEHGEITLREIRKTLAGSIA